MRTVWLKLPESLDRKLMSIAHRRKITRSAVLRQALELLAREPGRSVTALGRDLAGSLQGAADLSSPPRRMTGYGARRASMKVAHEGDVITPRSARRTPSPRRRHRRARG